MPKNPKVFFDIVIGNKAAGRIMFELFTDLTPITAENFRGLCEGEYGVGKSGYRLWYLDTLFHKIVPGSYCSGGDIIHNTGQGGDSIYGTSFPDEDFTRRHAHAGILSMANKGPDTNSSQFVITFNACPDLDGKFIVFGQVVEGMDVLRKIERVPTDRNDRPTYPVRIFNCGEIGDGREHIKFEEFKDQIEIYKGYQEKRAQRKEENMRMFREMKERKERQFERTFEEKEEVKEQREEIGQNEEVQEDKPLSKLEALKEKLKRARKLNEQAVAEENVRKQDPSFEKKKRRREWEEHERKVNEKLDELGIGTEKKYMIDNMAHVHNIEKKDSKKHRRAAYGWDIFNNDSLLRGYKRRTNKLQRDDELYQMQKDNPDLVITDPKPENVDKMAQELEKEQERRKKFSRRRPFYEDMDVNFINERNRVYNAKLERHFKQYAAEYKSNLDRGTAI